MMSNTRDIITRSLPGFFFLSQVMILALYSDAFEALAKSMLNKPVIFIFGFSLLSLLCGMCFENWGSFLEALFRRYVRPQGPTKWKDKNKFYSVWDAYLLLAIDGCPVGHRYLQL